MHTQSAQSRYIPLIKHARAVHIKIYVFAPAVTSLQCRNRAGLVHLCIQPHFARFAARSSLLVSVNDTTEAMAEMKCEIQLACRMHNWIMAWEMHGNILIKIWFWLTMQWYSITVLIISGNQIMQRWMQCNWYFTPVPLPTPQFLAANTYEIFRSLNMPASKCRLLQPCAVIFRWDQDLHRFVYFP